MTITDARTTRRGNIALEVDGEYLASVSEEAWLLSGLRRGGEVDEEALNELLQQSRAAEAKRRALNMLSSRSYTTRQLTDRIAQKTGREAAEAAVGRMEELGLVDDADYAARYALELFENRLYAPRRIRLELSKRGIPAALCEEAIEALDTGCLPERAAALLEARFGTLTTESERRRAAALLDRYGYPASIARAALRDARNYESSEETEDLE